MSKDGGSALILATDFRLALFVSFSPCVDWPLQVEVMIPGPKVGLIIGKGGETIKQLQARFSPHSSDCVAANYMLKIIGASFRNIRTRTYDFIQYYQNDIPY